MAYNYCTKDVTVDDDDFDSHSDGANGGGWDVHISNSTSTFTRCSHCF